MAKKINHDEVVEEWLDVSTLIPYEFNSKVHSKENIRGLQSSISRVGITNPITVDKNMVIIGGHGRLQACKNLGMTKVPVRVLAHLSDQEVKEARIADNKTASTDYDSVLMKLEFEQMDMELIDPAAIGFSIEEFEKFTITPDKIDVDAFTKNLDDDVDRQTKDAQKDITKADLKLTPVTNALGFKVATIADNRKISRFIASLQEQYDTEDPAAAFLRFIDEMAA